jgi:hypothetical protein
MMNPMQVWIEKLKAANPAERARSIRTLEQLGDTDALPALAEVFATDPEPALRAQAQQAGKVIYYGAIRRALELSSASETQRRQAADILAQARAKKNQRRIK